MQRQATVGICTLPPSASITITDWPLRLSQTSKPNLEGWEPGTPLLQSQYNDRVGTIAGLKDYQNSTCNFEGQSLTIWLHLRTTVKLGGKTFFRPLKNVASQTSWKLHSCIDMNTVFIDCRSQWDQSVSILICNLRRDFEGGWKVVLQTLRPRKKIWGYRATFLLPSKSLLRVQIKRLSVVFL